MRILIALAVAASLVGIFFATRDSEALNPAIQNQFDLAMDTDPTGNTATSLGTLDPCVAVNVNETFEVDLVVQGVPEPGAAAFTGNLIYDPNILKVVDRQFADLFLGSGGGPVFPFDDSPPDTDGSFDIQDINFGPEPTGDGVLTRVTFQAIAPGGSALTYDDTINGDPWQGDGVPDIYFIDPSEPGNYIGFFPNMRARGAEVVVGGTCPGNIIDTDGDEFGDVYEDYTESLAVQDCAGTPIANDEQFDSWPTDFDDNQTVNIGDVLAMKPVFMDTGPGIERYDLAPDGVINIGDVLAIKPVFGDSCTP